MRKVVLYSLLLILGLVLSQYLPMLEGVSGLQSAIRLLTMLALSFIMIHVGYEFEIDKTQPRQYAWDYLVAGTAAAFPWIFCALYFVFIMAPREMWGSFDLWKESLLEARFASPTSAGVLFSMLAAAGLAATWMFHKARVLAIFDDLDTVLLMIPLKILMVGLKWQLLTIVAFIVVLLGLAWRYLHMLRWPVSWRYVLMYAAAITIISEGIHGISETIDESVPVHIEVLLPAFALGCMLARPAGHDPHADDATEGVEEGPEAKHEQFVSTIVSACFMVLVGLSMPPISTTIAAPGERAVVSAHGATELGGEEHEYRYAGVAPEVVAEKLEFPGWGMMAVHVLVITLLSNLGKMFPALVYRNEATFRERLALSIAMFPRGEVGAGVLVISLSYGLAGPSLNVAILSLALNLLATGLFIVIVKKLLGSAEIEFAPRAATT